jgi:hypothetical protein
MGIVDDGMANSDVLLQALAEELERAYGARRTTPIVKPSISSPLPGADFDRLILTADFVLVGVGL